jgi:hypothetical protein
MTRKRRENRLDEAGKKAAAFNRTVFFNLAGR